jgi:hypothetical protein
MSNKRQAKPLNTGLNRQMKIAEEQRKHAEAQLQAEVAHFTQQVLNGLKNPSDEIKELVAVLAYQQVSILRGFKLRIEQFGGSVSQISALAKHAWDAVQTTIEALCRQEAKRHAQAVRLKNVFAEAALTAQEGGSLASIFADIAENLDPDDWGVKDHVEANDLFGACARDLRAQAEEAQAQNQNQTVEVQSREMLERLVRENPQEVADLPSMQEVMLKQRQRPN